MVDWQSQSDPVAMAVSALLVVATGVAFAWYGAAAGAAIGAVDVAAGAAAALVAVALQTWVATRDRAVDGQFGPRWLRALVAAGAGVAAVAALDAVPGAAAAFGAALVPLGVGSRLYLYRRAST